MKISSPAFKDNELIPSLYTCEGKNCNPPLEFSDVPAAAQSLVLIMDDPDVPAQVRPEQMYDHWIVFNIPPSTSSLKANTTPVGLEGQNTSGKIGYTGPCPPKNYLPTRHRYHFKLYALQKMLCLPSGATKGRVEEAMAGYILAEAKLVGVYEKVKQASNS